MIALAFETEVLINCPIDDVFAYVSDPLNFPDWNSAVERVRQASDGDDGVASIYVMERELPNGRAVNELEVLLRERPREFAIRTTGGPTPFLYQYRFFAAIDQTVLRLEAEVELPAPAAFALPLARRAVKKGVDDNFATLKAILEARLR